MSDEAQPRKAVKIVSELIEAQGFQILATDEENGFQVVRLGFRGNPVSSVTISPAMHDASEESLQALVLEACRAAASSPATKSENYAA